MFEISFGEILVIAVVALIVLGPERLPAVARTLGALVGRAQRFVSNVKADIQQQSQMAGFDDLKRDVQDAAYAFRQQVESEAAEVRQIATTTGQELQQQLKEPGDLLAEASETIRDSMVESSPADDKTSGEPDNQLDLFKVSEVKTPPSPPPSSDNPEIKVRE